MALTQPRLARGAPCHGAPAGLAGHLGSLPGSCRLGRSGHLASFQGSFHLVQLDPRG